MKPLKGVKVVYMQPKEGALAWICSFAIAAEPKNEDLAYAYLNTAYSAPSMDYLVNAFFTGGAAMTPATLAKIGPQVRQAVPPQLAQHRAQAAEGVARAAPREPQRLSQGVSAGQVGLIDGTRGGRRVRPPRGSRRGSARLRTCSSARAGSPAPPHVALDVAAAAARPGGADRVLPRTALLRLPVLDGAALPGRDEGGRADQRRAHELLVGSLARAARNRRHRARARRLAEHAVVAARRARRRPARGRAARQPPAALRRCRRGRLPGAADRCRSSRCPPATRSRALRRSPPTIRPSRSSSARSRRR